MLRLAAAVLIAVSLLAGGCRRARKPVPRPSAIPNQVLYDRGRTLIEERKFEKARATLTEIGSREVVDPALDPLVKIAVADAYFYDPGIANLIEAQSRYTQFLTFYPSHELASYAQFQVGVCYFKQSPEPYHDQTYTRKALEEFDKVRTMAPEASFVEAAAHMRERCLEKLGRHDYQVGLFYYKRKQYDGAIERFRALLDDYPQFLQSDGVYYHLGLALVRSGQPAEGQLYLEKVQRDYPTSKFAAKAREAAKAASEGRSAVGAPAGVVPGERVSN